MADLGPLKPLDSTNKDALLWKRDEHDWYVEPHWCSRRLFAEENFTGEVIDPACGVGRIVEAAHHAGHPAIGFDIVRRSDICARIRDFRTLPIARNVISNPPFNLADAFARHMLEVTTDKVALLLPTRWMNGQTRARWLQTTPLYRVWLLTPRPSMPPGAVATSGVKVGGGTVDFAWFVWLKGFDGHPQIRWLHRD